MTCGEVTAYLSRFPPDQPVSIIVLDAGELVQYEIGAHLLAKNKLPALILEVTGAKPLNKKIRSRSNEKSNDNNRSNRNDPSGNHRVRQAGAKGIV